MNKQDLFIIEFEIKKIYNKLKEEYEAKYKRFDEEGDHLEAYGQSNRITGLQAFRDEINDFLIGLEAKL